MNVRRQNILVVMAKHPRAGHTKTRLSPPLTYHGAASLYECFLRDTLDLVRSLPDTRFVVAYTPAEEEAYFIREAPDFELMPQQGATLGERLDNVISHYLTIAPANVVALDSDSPTLPATYLARAFEYLSNSIDVVIGPCNDGGYYLIGFSRPAPQLLREVQMSTSRVTENTVALARTAGLCLQLLPGWYDVDDSAGLEHLRNDLAVLPITTAPRTRKFIEEAGA